MTAESQQQPEVGKAAAGFSLTTVRWVEVELKNFVAMGGALLLPERFH